MNGGIGTCNNPTCMQTGLLLEDGYCSDDCRMEATGCSVPGCYCLGADDGVSRCGECERYTWGVVAGRCSDGRSAAKPAASTGAGDDGPSRPDCGGCTNTRPSGGVCLQLGRLPPSPA
jgi:hypothetical protein